MKLLPGHERCRVSLETDSEVERLVSSRRSPLLEANRWHRISFSKGETKGD